MRARRAVLMVAVVLAALGVATSAPPAGAAVAPPVPKAIVLTATSTSTIWSQATRLAVSITPKGGGTPKGGTVTFRTGEQVLGTAAATKRITTLSTTALPVGESSVTATYSGDAGIRQATSNPVTITVAQATSTTTLTGGPDVIPVGEQAELKAIVRATSPAAATSRPTGTVTFTTLGRTATVKVNTTGVATWRPLLPEGTYEITATYNGSDAHIPSTSDIFTQVMSPPAVTESTVDQSNPEATGWMTSNAGYSVGQSFTAGRSGLLDRVTVDFPVADKPFTIAVYTFEFGSPFEGPYSRQSGATVQGPTDIALLEPIAVEAGRSYAIVLDSGDDAPLEISTTEDTYAGGTMLWFDQTAGGWETWSTSDLAFTTWVRPIPET